MVVVDYKMFNKDCDVFEVELVSVIEVVNFDIICLVGFMCIFGVDFICWFEGKMLNIYFLFLLKYKGLYIY